MTDSGGINDLVDVTKDFITEFNTKYVWNISGDLYKGGNNFKMTITK